MMVSVRSSSRFRIDHTPRWGAVILTRLLVVAAIVVCLLPSGHVVEAAVLPQVLPPPPQGKLSDQELKALADWWNEVGRPGLMVVPGSGQHDPLLAAAIEAQCEGLSIRAGGSDMAARIGKAMDSAAAGAMDIEDLEWLQESLAEDAQLVLSVDTMDTGMPRVRLLDRRFGDVASFLHRVDWDRVVAASRDPYGHIAGDAVRRLFLRTQPPPPDSRRRISIAVKAFQTSVLTSDLCDEIAMSLEDAPPNNTEVHRVDSKFDRGSRSAMFTIDFEGRFRRLDSAFRKAIQDQGLAGDVVGSDGQLWSSLFVYKSERPRWCEVTDPGTEAHDDLRRLLRNAEESAEGIRFAIVVSSELDLMTRAYGFEALRHEPRHDALRLEIEEWFRDFELEVVDTAAIEERRKKGLAPFDEVDFVLLVRDAGEGKYVVQMTDRRTARVMTSFSVPDVAEVVRDQECTVEWDQPRSVARYMSGKVLEALGHRLDGEPMPLTVVARNLPDRNGRWLGTFIERVEALPGVGRGGIRQLEMDTKTGTASFSVPYRGQPDRIIREILDVTEALDPQPMAGYRSGTFTIGFLPEAPTEAPVDAVVDAPVGAPPAEVQVLASESVACVTFAVLDPQGKEICKAPVGTCWYLGDGWFATNAHVVMGLLKYNVEAQRELAEQLAQGWELRWSARFDGEDGPRLIHFDRTCADFVVPPNAVEKGELLKEVVLPALQATAKGVHVHPSWLSPDLFAISDAAILKVDDASRAEAEKIPALRLATIEEAEAVRIGQQIHYGGFPMESVMVNAEVPPMFVVSGRIVSMANAQLAPPRNAAEARLLYFDAVSTGGSSGSPILDDQGRVIGINWGGSYVFSDLNILGEDGEGNQVQYVQTVRSPSGFKYAARVDAIHELLRMR